MIKIYPAVFNGTIKAPSACAHAQRLLFMAAASVEPTRVENVADCEDVDTAIGCLKELGCIVEKDGDAYNITPFPKAFSARILNFDFGKSATTARIATTMAAAFGMRANCTASEDWHRRSDVTLISRLAIRGVKFTNFALPYSFSGRLEPGDYTISTGEGSHFASALLMSLPMLPGPSTLRFETRMQDTSFVKLTVKSLKEFGIETELIDKGFSIPGKQIYRSPGTISTENDWGLASLWIAAGAAAGEGKGKVVVEQLPDVSPQLYRNVTRELPLIAQDFMELDFNAKDCPGLATFYAAMAAVKGATVTITGVPQLKNKETNRLAVMKEICEALGQKAVVTDDGLIITGTGEANYDENTVVDPKGDPWIFLSMALAASKLQKPIIIKDENCVNKIYRDFFKDYEALGGKYEVL